MTVQTQNARAKAQIMIVEDEGLIAADIQSTVRGLGYHVSGIAGSADEALELASMFTSQVVLMDIKIKGPVDGIDLAQELRDRYQTPIVFLTSNTDAGTFERARRTVPFGFVTKPFSDFHLKAAIELALSRSEVEKASHKKEAGLAAVLESLPDAIVATDMDGHIVFVNRAAESMTGWTAGAALGQQVDDVLQMGEASASELVGDVYSGDLLNAPVTVASREGVSGQWLLSGSALMSGRKKGGAVLLFRSGVSGQRQDAGSALRATEEMLSTLCLLRLDEMTQEGTCADLRSASGGLFVDSVEDAVDEGQRFVA